MSKHLRVAVDVGGTFTDVVSVDQTTHQVRFEKVPTTPKEPTRGVLEGFRKADARFEDIDTFNHGTTLGLNSLLTRTGAKTAVIGTKGFRDVYLLGRTDRKPMYDLTYHKPKGLVERADTFEVPERVFVNGSPRVPLDKVAARRVAETIRNRGYRSVAIAFINAYHDPANENAMRDVLRSVIPDIEISTSHELSREFREYERTSTTVLDAYIKPIIRSYLDELSESLGRSGFDGRFFLSRSAGGAMTAAAASERPVDLILSGPAGGVVGAVEFSKLVDEPNLITIDMGGTSLDASLVIDHQPVLYNNAEFEGLPINTPSLYIHTIGAGGGSIASLNDVGALQVGPQSAGAEPGPASYGRGGTEPTFTDAALEIGYLGVDSPLGGELALDKTAAERALAPIAERLHLEVGALAQGIVRISTMKIVGAVRAITIDLGRNPKDFALLSLGGAGGLVALDVARELGIPKVIVPPGQGAFCALGMLMADVQHDYSRTNVSLLSDLSAADLHETFDLLTDEGSARLTDEGFDEEHRTFIRSLDLRYKGQEHAVTLPLPDVPDEELIGEIIARFHQLHELRYGHSMDDPVQLTTIRVTAIGRVDSPELPHAKTARKHEVVPEHHRRVLRPSKEGVDAIEYGTITREELKPGDIVEGPAVISEYTATTVIHPGDTLEVGAYGELQITINAHHE